MEITREQGYDSLRRIFGVFSYNRFPLLRFTIPVYDMEPIEHTDLSSAYAIIPVQYPNEIDLIEIVEAHNQFVNGKGDSGVLKNVTKPLMDLLQKKGGVEYVAHVLATNELELKNINDKKTEWDAFMGFIMTRENGKPVPYTPHPGYIDTNPERAGAQRQDYEKAVKEWERYWTNRCRQLHIKAYWDDCEAVQGPMIPSYYLERHQSIATQLESGIADRQTMVVSSVIFKYVYGQMKCWNEFEVYIEKQGRIITGNVDFNGLKWKEVNDSQYDGLKRELEITPFSYNSIKGIERYWKVVKKGDTEQLWLNEGVPKERAIKFIANSHEAKKARWSVPTRSQTINLFMDHKGENPLYPKEKDKSYRTFKSELEKKL